MNFTLTEREREIICWYFLPDSYWVCSAEWLYWENVFLLFLRWNLADLRRRKGRKKKNCLACQPTHPRGRREKTQQQQMRVMMLSKIETKTHLFCAAVVPWRRAPRLGLEFPFSLLVNFFSAEEKSKIQRDWCVWATKLDDKLKWIHLNSTLLSGVCLSCGERCVLWFKMKVENSIWMMLWSFFFSSQGDDEIEERNGMCVAAWLNKEKDNKIDWNFNLIKTKIECEEISIFFIEKCHFLLFVEVSTSIWGVLVVETLLQNQKLLNFPLNMLLKFEKKC